jgi:hypothetical protein
VFDTARLASVWGDGRVIDARHVNFNGEVTSPSEAARRALGVPYRVQDPVYWEFDGETLDERRRMDEGDE